MINQMFNGNELSASSYQIKPWPYGLDLNKWVYVEDPYHPTDFYTEIANTPKPLRNRSPTNYTITYSKEEKAVVLAKLAGYKKEDMNISLENRCLHIKATSSSEFIGKTLDQKIIVGYNENDKWEVDSATYESGLLTVEMHLVKNKKMITIT